MGNAVLDADRVLSDHAKARSRGDQEIVRLAQESLAHALELPTSTRAFWQQLLRIPAAELHARRDQVRDAFDHALTSTSHTPEIVRVAGQLNSAPLAGAERLPAARQELAQFVEMILSRWKSRDDLVQLMIDTIELPEWVLKGPNPPGVGFPQHWIDDEDDDPFQPLPDAQ